MTPVTGSPVASSNDLGVSALERVAAIVRNPDLYTLMDGYTKADRTLGGRPQIYPDYLVPAIGAFSRIFGSARAAITALHGPVVWDFIRGEVREQNPDDPARWLPEKPPSRTWYVKRKKQLGLRGLEPLRHAFTQSGVTTAREIGLLDPDGPGTQTHPDATRMIYHDGKAIRQMFNGAPGDTREVRITDPDTGESTIEQRPVRADPDAKVHITGDNRQIHGLKFMHAEARGAPRFSRVFLAVDYVPTVKDEKNSEADITVKNLLELAPLVPGALGVMCDTVLRGTHINTLVRDTGWVVMNPVAAKTIDKKTGERTEKEVFLPTEKFRYDDGDEEDVEIWTAGGGLVRVVYADDGTRVAVPLERIGNVTRKNANGQYRAYVVYLVPDPRGGTPRRIMEPILQRPEDTLNRPENVRQIPPGDPDYVRLIGLRSDAEAANRAVDDDLYLRRAASVGAHGQLFDLICHAFVQNSIARHRHGARGRPPPAVAA